MERTGNIRDIWLADGSIRHCEEVWIDVNTPYISGLILTLVLDVPFADLVTGNYVNKIKRMKTVSVKIEDA